MGIGMYTTFIETVDWRAINWEDINREKAKTYLLDCEEMPKSYSYPSIGNLLHDVRTARGVIAFSKKENETFLAFFKDMLEEVY